MPLSEQDLNSIRMIVRDEIEKALRLKRDAAAPSSMSTDIAEESSGDGEPSPEELASAMVEAMYGWPKEKARHWRLVARLYVARNDRSWITRAMKARQSPSDAPVSVDEMAECIRTHEERKEARRAQRQSQKQKR